MQLDDSRSHSLFQTAATNTLGTRIFVQWLMYSASGRDASGRRCTAPFEDPSTWRTTVTRIVIATNATRSVQQLLVAAAPDAVPPISLQVVSFATGRAV